MRQRFLIWNPGNPTPIHWGLCGGLGTLEVRFLYQAAKGGRNPSPPLCFGVGASPEVDAWSCFPVYLCVLQVITFASGFKLVCSSCFLLILRAFIYLLVSLLVYVVVLIFLVLGFIPSGALCSGITLNLVGPLQGEVPYLLYHFSSPILL